MTFNPTIKKVSEDCGIEAVTKFKYLGVTISTSKTVMLKEAKIAWD